MDYCVHANIPSKIEMVNELEKIRAMVTRLSPDFHIFFYEERVQRLGLHSLKRKSKTASCSENLRSRGPIGDDSGRQNSYKYHYQHFHGGKHNNRHMEQVGSHDYNSGGRQSSKGKQQAYVPMPMCMMSPTGQPQPPPPPHVLIGAPFNVCNFNCSVPPMMPLPLPPMLSAKEMAGCFVPPPPIGRHMHQKINNKQPLLPTPQTVSPEVSSEASLPQDDSAIVIDLTSSERLLMPVSSGASQKVTSASISTQTPLASMQAQQIHLQQLMQPQPQHYPVLSYLDSLSIAMWQYFIDTRQTSSKYAKKVQFRNALHMMVSSVFENSKLFIVGSSINGFGTDQSDMDLCLTVTSQELQAKRETSVVLTQLMTPLRNCSFIRNCNLIRAKVPILKFRDSLSGVDCDLNVNNVVGIYNTHLLAMYTRVDWRVRPLGMFVKHWANKMDIHDGARGRLSTYPLILMLLQYLQCGCSPPVIPNLQVRFPKLFNYERPVVELDMRLQLPWIELRSTNTATLAELFSGFVHYYAGFDFSRWAVSVKHGAPMPIDIAIRCLPPHEQAHTACSFKIFVEEPFCQANAARSLYDDSVLALIQQAFTKTDQVLHLQKPLESLWTSNSASSAPLSVDATL